MNTLLLLCDREHSFVQFISPWFRFSCYLLHTGVGVGKMFEVTRRASINRNDRKSGGKGSENLKEFDRRLHCSFLYSQKCAGRMPMQLDVYRNKFTSPAKDAIIAWMVKSVITVASQLGSKQASLIACRNRYPIAGQRSNTPTCI